MCATVFFLSVRIRGFENVGPFWGVLARFRGFLKDTNKPFVFACSTGLGLIFVNLDQGQQRVSALRGFMGSRREWIVNSEENGHSQF